MKQHLGKIVDAYVGFGGRDDDMIGFWLAFEYEYDKYYSAMGKGCFENRPIYEEIMRDVYDTLKKAKKQRVEELVGVPVEVTLNDYGICDWRILTEVL